MFLGHGGRGEQLQRLQSSWTCHASGNLPPHTIGPPPSSHQQPRLGRPPTHPPTCAPPPPACPAAAASWAPTRPPAHARRLNPAHMPRTIPAGAIRSATPHKEYCCCCRPVGFGSHRAFATAALCPPSRTCLPRPRAPHLVCVAGLDVGDARGQAIAVAEGGRPQVAVDAQVLQGGAGLASLGGRPAGAAAAGRGATPAFQGREAGALVGCCTVVKPGWAGSKCLQAATLRPCRQLLAAAWSPAHLGMLGGGSSSPLNCTMIMVMSSVRVSYCGARGSRRASQPHRSKCVPQQLRPEQPHALASSLPGRWGCPPPPSIVHHRSRLTCSHSRYASATTLMAAS